MSRKGKHGPVPDAEIVARAEAAASVRGRVTRSIMKVLDQTDAMVDAKQPIDFSWLGLLGKLLEDNRRAEMWNAADDGSDDEGAPR